jgi:hypothetical protein
MCIAAVNAMKPMAWVKNLDFADLLQVSNSNG